MAVDDVQISITKESSTHAVQKASESTVEIIDDSKADFSEAVSGSLDADTEK